MNRQDFGEIYALGWFGVVFTINFWAESSLMPYCVTYLCAMFVVAIISI